MIKHSLMLILNKFPLILVQNRESIQQRITTKKALLQQKGQQIENLRRQREVDFLELSRERRNLERFVDKTHKS